jgi:peroxiredoxin
MRKTSTAVWMSWSGWLLVLCCGAGVPPAVAAEPAMAPDFALKADSGRNLRLREMRGQVVMINFWATWCGPCREEMPKLQQLYSKYRETGFVLLGVNIDDNPANAVSMARKLRVTFPVLFDKDKQVSKLYKVDAMPSTVLIDRDGKTRYLHRGYKPGYEATYQTQLRELLKE